MFNNLLDKNIGESGDAQLLLVMAHYYRLILHPAESINGFQK